MGVYSPKFSKTGNLRTYQDCLGRSPCKTRVWTGDPRCWANFHFIFSRQGTPEPIRIVSKTPTQNQTRMRNQRPTRHAASPPVRLRRAIAYPHAVPRTHLLSAPTNQLVGYSHRDTVKSIHPNTDPTVRCVSEYLYAQRLHCNGPGPLHACCIHAVCIRHAAPLQRCFDVVLSSLCQLSWQP